MYLRNWNGKGVENGAHIIICQEGGDGVSDDVDEKQIAEEPCSEAYLRRVTGEDDLGTVRNLVLTVDSNETQV